MDDELAEIIRLLPGCVEPLDERAAGNLDRYCWRAVELRRHRLIDFGRSAGIVEWEERPRFPPLSPDESTEALESLCLRFRRLDAHSDVAAFPTVRGTLVGWLKGSSVPESQQVMLWLSDLKKRRTALHRRWVRSETIVIVAGDGTRTPISPRDAIDLVFNGEMFHGDPGKEAELAELGVGGWQIMIGPAIYHQIFAFSSLYEALALAVASILNEPSLVPFGFDPFLRPVT